jgi:hypothetical protein
MVTGNERATDPRAWLERFPPARRSAIANWYHDAVRNGASTPAAVVQQVRQTVQRHLQWASAHPEEAHLHAVLESLQTDSARALAYAAAVITYEQMPYEARQRVKAERAVPYVQEAMRGQAVTEKQAAYLRALGYVGTLPADRAEASRLIDHWKRGGVRP